MCTCDDVDLCCYFEDPDHPPPKFGTQNDCVKDSVEESLESQKIESSSINVTPSTLKFPYNSPKCHTQRLTLWNRTIKGLKIRIKSPDTNVFTVHINGKKKKTPGAGNQVVLFGLAAKTISIKCTPGRYKIARFFLRLLMYTSSDNCECLEVPLEIYPSTAWFQLPKTIVIPDVMIGRKAHALILLPQPKISERFFVTFHTAQTQNSITLSPINGTIGGDDGIKQLKVTYAPFEYTTVSCSINVHFPGLSTNAAHEIKILGRCRPGNEADIIRKEITEIESFRPKPVKKKRIFPKLRFSAGRQDFHPTESVHQQQDASRDLNKTLSLFTMGGVMRFLLSKAESESGYHDHHPSKRKTAVELLVLDVDLNDDEKIKIYNSMKKRLGFDFDPGSTAPRPRLKSNQRRDWEEFQNAVGITLMGRVEELPHEEPQASVSVINPRKSKHPQGPQSHGSGVGASSSKTGDIKYVRPSVSEDEQRMYKSIMADVQLDLTPKEKFVQLILKLVTRQRAEKRLRKLKVLVEEIKKATRRRSSKGSAYPISKNHDNEGSGSLHSNNSKPMEKYGSKIPIAGDTIPSRKSTFHKRKSSASQRKPYDL